MIPALIRVTARRRSGRRIEAGSEKKK